LRRLSILCCRSPTDPRFFLIMADPSSSLMPQHSADLAAELSAHLSSALASDKSYSQMNDAKMRGMSAMAGWDQFHGMVLTAHLAPVNLKSDPIDAISKGIARNKKIEQQKSRAQTNFALEQLSSERRATEQQEEHRSAAEQQRNTDFLAEFSLHPPTNAHEFARDWKKLAATAAESSSQQPPAQLAKSRRYRYLTSIRLVGQAQALLKGGIPLDMIGGIIDVVHWQWIASQSEAATSAAATDAGPSADATTSASSPTPFDLHHLVLLLHSLTTMSSFPISVFSLTRAEKAQVSEILERAERTMEGGEWRKWKEEREAADAATSEMQPAASTMSSATPTTADAQKPEPTAASAYPMMLSGWPAGVGDMAAPSASTSSARSSGHPARDESSAGNHMTVTSSAPAVRKPEETVQVTRELVAQLRAKYKVQ
jgi:hypothetical protein